VIAEDNAVIRKGLVMLLRMEAGIEVVGEAGDGPTAVRLAAELGPDVVVVMDINLPGGLTGIEATRQITGGGAGPKVVALSGHSDKVVVGQMVAAGASGYVLKVSAGAELADAVRAVAAGGTYFSPAVAADAVGPNV
jgi:DNA-binding NarL/FixJ family response regulator